jgi:hypothetical protein
VSLRSAGLKCLSLVCVAGAVYLAVVGLGFWAFLLAATGICVYLASLMAP